jgi:hypothetical protein
LQILPQNYISHLDLSNGILNVFVRKFLLKTPTNKGIWEEIRDPLAPANEQMPPKIELPFEKYIFENKNKAQEVA